MFALTGSQNFTLSRTVSQSLAGRTAILTLLPLSLIELGDLSKKLSTAIFSHIYSGFYPRLRNTKTLSPTQYYADYFQTYAQRDVRDLANIRDLRLFERFLRL